MLNRFWIYSAFAETIEDSKRISHIDSWFKLIQNNSLWIYLTDRENTIERADSLEFTKQIVNSRKRYWIQSEFIMNSLWIHHLISEFIMNSISFTQIQSWFFYVFHRLTLNSISVSRIYYFFAISLGILNHFGNWLWIHFSIKNFYGKFIRIELRDFTFNLLSEFTIWIHDTFCALAFNLESFSRLHYEFTLFRKFSINSLPVSPLHFEYSIFFANLL